MATKQKALPGMAKMSPRPSRVPGYKRRTPEADEQAALIRWARLWASHGTHPIPALGLLHSSLNGVALTPGQAVKAKAGGMLAGVWDLFLPVAHGETWAGFWIEMKAGRGVLSREQKAFQRAVGIGYRWEDCYSWHDAARVLLEYLGTPRTHPAWSGLEETK